MTAPQPHRRYSKQLDAGLFQAEISSFRLHLAAEGKAAKTIRTYTEAVQWFAAAHLLQQAGRARWGKVDGQDVQCWMVWLLGRYSTACASNQYRACSSSSNGWLPAPLQPHVARTRRAGRRPDGTERLEYPADAHFLYGASARSARSARARRTYDRVMDERP